MTSPPSHPCPLSVGEGERGRIRGQHATELTTTFLLEFGQDLHQRLALAVGVPIAMAIATATASTLATAFARAATPSGNWSCRSDGRLGFLALGDTDILGNLVDILGVLHAS